SAKSLDDGRWACSSAAGKSVMTVLASSTSRCASSGDWYLAQSSLAHGPRPTMMTLCLRYCPITATAQSIRQPHDESQGDIEAPDVNVAEPTYQLPDPSSPDRDRFVGHYLRTDLQA